MCTALPALGDGSTLLIVSHCGEKLGSPAYTELMVRLGRRLARLPAAHRRPAARTELDQWEFQMQARVL